MSDWKKMTKEQKAKRNARRRALHAERKAAAEAKAKKCNKCKRTDVTSCADCKNPPSKLGCGKKKCPKFEKKPVPLAEQKPTVHVTADQLSQSEKVAFDVLKRATDERIAVEKCVSVVGNALMDLVRTFRPGVAKIVIEHKDPAPAKKAPAKK